MRTKIEEVQEKKNEAKKNSKTVVDLTKGDTTEAPPKGRPGRKRKYPIQNNNQNDVEENKNKKKTKQEDVKEQSQSQSDHENKQKEEDENSNDDNIDSKEIEKNWTAALTLLKEKNSEMKDMSTIIASTYFGLLNQQSDKLNSKNKNDVIEQCCQIFQINNDEFDNHLQSFLNPDKEDDESNKENKATKRDDKNEKDDENNDDDNKNEDNDDTNSKNDDSNPPPNKRRRLNENGK